MCDARCDPRGRPWDPVGPLHRQLPKTPEPLGDVPVVEVLIRRLIEHRITDITLTLGHLADLVQAYFDNRHGLTEQINLSFVREDEPTGTAGSLSMVPGLTETFLAMNGDLLTDIDFDALVRHHHEQKALLTIAVRERRTPIDLGVLEFDANRVVTAYVEKPESLHHVSMGVYVYEPAVLEHIEKGAYLDFPDLVLRLIERGEKVSAFLTDCSWLDIGRPDDYARAQELYAKSNADVDLV